MELSELKDKIYESFTGSKDELDEILNIVEKDNGVSPFNEYEFLVCNLIEKKKLTYEQYLEIRAEYIAQNIHLQAFEISAPRRFGEEFAQTYVQGMCGELQKPSKKLDKKYTRQYDLWLDGIRIEVKASRAVDSSSPKPLYQPLYVRALPKATNKPFVFNFQQLKPQCCDVFIWVAVFIDEIVLWVMNSDEVASNPLFSKGQHRGNRDNEGQLHIKHNNIHVLDDYELGGNELGQFIRDAAKRKPKNVNKQPKPL